MMKPGPVAATAPTTARPTPKSHDHHFTTRKRELYTDTDDKNCLPTRVTHNSAHHHKKNFETPQWALGIVLHMPLGEETCLA